MIALMAAALVAGCADKSDPPRSIPGADAANGLAAMRRVGCGACHAIPGLDWPKGRAGPTLEGFGRRPLIAGRLPNQPDVLTAFLMDAPSLAPDTAMPPMPITAAEARDIAAYLYARRD